MYVCQARQEEREANTEFGDEYIRTAAKVPAFIPHLDFRTAVSAAIDPEKNHWRIPE